MEPVRSLNNQTIVGTQTDRKDTKDCGTQCYTGSGKTVHTVSTETEHMMENFGVQVEKGILHNPESSYYKACYGSDTESVISTEDLCSPTGEDWDIDSVSSDKSSASGMSKNEVPVSIVHKAKYLVFKSCLDKLLKHCLRTLKHCCYNRRIHPRKHAHCQVKLC